MAALLAILVCGALDWGHLGGDDPGCDVVLVQHDHSAHRFSSAPANPLPPGEHCYLCHSLRLLHVSLAAHPQRVADDVNSARLAAPDRTAPLDAFGVSVSSRGPPSVRS